MICEIYWKKKITKKVINCIKAQKVTKGKDVGPSCNTKKGKRKKKKLENFRGENIENYGWENEQWCRHQMLEIDTHFLGVALLEELICASLFGYDAYSKKNVLWYN